MTKMRFIDLHCDTVVCEVMGNEDSKNLRSNPTGMLDLLRMKEAGCLLQCFALYIPPMKRIASTTGEFLQRCSRLLRPSDSRQHGPYPPRR